MPAGQSQKEGHVNEALARIDALLHLAVEGQLSTPPPAPAEGQCWLVGASPGAGWTGKAGAIACFESGNWLFATPRDGMVLVNRATGQTWRYLAGWQHPARPTAPSGGATVDTEARAAISALIQVLATAGIIPAS